MSVGRFQLALRALDLRAAPCPRGLLRPSGSVVGVRPLFGGPNPALAAGDVLAGSTQGARHCGSGERTYLDVFAQFNAAAGSYSTT